MRAKIPESYLRYTVTHQIKSSEENFVSVCVSESHCNISIRLTLSMAKLLPLYCISASNAYKIQLNVFAHYYSVFLMYLLLSLLQIVL